MTKQVSKHNPEMIFTLPVKIAKSKCFWFFFKYKFLDLYALIKLPLRRKSPIQSDFFIFKHFQGFTSICSLNESEKVQQLGTSLVKIQTYEEDAP